MRNARRVRAARADAERVLGREVEVFAVDGTVYVRGPGDTWYAHVDRGDGPRLQLLVSCERCEHEEPERFDTRFDAARGVLVPVRSLCDHCLFSEAATGDAPLGDLLDLALPPPASIFSDAREA